MAVPDYAVLIVYLLVLLGIGWFFRSGGRDNASFFLAGRSMGYFPIGLSVMVTTFSALNFLAFPGEVYANGLYVLISLPVFFLAAVPVVLIWMPFFHRMKPVSVYEYFEKRFDWRVRTLASGLFIFWRLFWMAAALFASAQLLSRLTGFPLTGAILASGVIATLYTALGGMKAVMWTDVLQFFVLFGGILLCVCNAGPGGLFEIAGQTGKLKPWIPFDASYFSFDPTIRITFWSGLLGTFVMFLSRYGADQMVMQRYFSARDLGAARRGLWLNGIVSVLSLGLLVVFGLSLYAACAAGGSEPGVRPPFLAAMTRLFRSLPPGVGGLVAAGLFAATMSSIDSGLNSCCAAYLSDFHARFFRRTVSVRWLTLAIGMLVTVLALTLIPLTARHHSLFALINKFINALGSPLLAMMLLAMFSRRVNAAGMFWGSLGGFVSCLVISFTVRALALHYYAVVDLAVTVILCHLFSRIAGTEPTAENLRWLWRKNPIREEK
ncbi:MAG: sodium/solute symporter [Lentisphaeria bacterium]|nr:sodium/solute symporter [Lentisphaeria bacterium]